MDKSKLFQKMENLVRSAQCLICNALVEQDQNVLLVKDEWDYSVGTGGGTTCVLKSGDVFEKGGINISLITGVLPEFLASHLNTEVQPFQVCGLSIVIHPLSPHIPTIHMNVRYFEMENRMGWFGGGIDLTPYILDEESFILFHQELKTICNRYQKNIYNVYKKQCDEYFFIKHRNEMRGIGGIFFDYLKDDPEKVFLFIQDITNSFIPIYNRLLVKHHNKEYSPLEKEFQMIRRGRYVEFNLLYDRGTLFGLQTNGRVESILISLPEHVQFTYDYKVPKELESILPYYQPRDYVLS